MNKNAINWAEIPVNDFERAKNFYEEILGSQLQTMNMNKLEYGFLPYDPAGGGVGAAIVKGSPYTPNATGTVIYLNGGDDLNTCLLKVENAKGKVIVPKVQISLDFGFMGLFLDTEGNKVGLHSMK